MLLRFAATNHASIADRQELSMIAVDDHEGLAVGDVPGMPEVLVLPVVAIFGPNASGKSNILDALAYMCCAVEYSHQRWLPDKPIPRRPYLLTDGQTQPSVYEIDFVVGGVRHNYGFSLDDETVVEEWLYSYPERRRRLLFERMRDEPIRFGPTLPGQKRLVERSVRPNSLFLSAAFANNLQATASIYRWFSRRCRIANAVNEESRLAATFKVMEKESRQDVLDLLLYADLGVTGMEIKKRGVGQEERDRPHRILNTPEINNRDVDLDTALSCEVEVHHKVGSDIGTLPFKSESTGAKTWLSLAGPVLTTLKTGSVLVVDELDARLHPSLTAELVRMFQDPSINKNGAQLVFNSHDVSLLGRNVRYRLRRDQVWFTEKDEFGATKLFPLIEYSDGLDNVERAYLRGRYGAVPFFDDLILEHVS